MCLLSWPGLLIVVYCCLSFLSSMVYPANNNQHDTLVMSVANYNHCSTLGEPNLIYNELFSLV